MMEQQELKFSLKNRFLINLKKVGSNVRKQFRIGLMFLKIN